MHCPMKSDTLQKNMYIIDQDNEDKIIKTSLVLKLQKWYFPQIKFGQEGSSLIRLDINFF